MTVEKLKTALFRQIEKIAYFNIIGRNLVDIAGLTSICKEKETAIKAALDELKEWGYLTVTKLMPNQTESGRIEYVYDFYEYSEKDKPDAD